MAVQREIWVDYIIGNLFKDNDILSKAYREDDYVLGGKVVHIPQAGPKPVIVKDRSTLPATASERTDTDITYPLEWYSSDPIRIRNAEQAELSYEKMQSVLGETMEAFQDRMADEMIIKWLVGAIDASNIQLTTGANAAAKVAGQTGTRKVLTVNDVKALALKFNLQNIAKNDRVLLLESNLLDELTSDLSITQSRDFSQYFDASKGIVGKLFGFEIMERSNVGIVNAANDTVDAYGAAIAATDHVAALAFQKNSVAVARGEVNFFENKQDALHYGDVHSADVRFGGRARRTNAEGVFALVQAPGA